MAAIDLSAIRERSTKAWSQRSAWTGIYQDAYDYVLPQRMPGGAGRKKNSPDRLFDMTGPMSAMFFAGSLQRDLFPAGQPTFQLETGPIAAMNLSKSDKDKYDRYLEGTASLIHPFFLAGDFDTAIHEMCIDLAIGTGAIIPVKGNSRDPVQFVCIPFDQLAIQTDGFGRVRYVSWKQNFERQQLLELFPEGKWPEGFENDAKVSGTQEVELIQDFYVDPGGYGWHYCAYMLKSVEPIKTEVTLTQPIAVPRYYRVPGEAYGRGVVLTALPSIKTLNKAQELALKSAAIQMLGIWGYRAGGTFNPDTVRLGPGEMWAMQSTGGVLGPDVQRLDPASGRMDVAKMLIGDLQQQIKGAMFDTRLPEYSGTPKSASEIAGLMKQKSDIHIGAFGRLINEIMPVIVPRVAEILYDLKILSNLPTRIDNLLVSIKVRSPMAAALNADRLAAIANYLQMVASMAGPQAVQIYANMDKIIERVGSGLQIDKELIPTEDERKKIQDDMEKAKQQQMQQMMLMEAAKQIPKTAGNIAENQMAQAA